MQNFKANYVFILGGVAQTEIDETSDVFFVKCDFRSFITVVKNQTSKKKIILESSDRSGKIAHFSEDFQFG